MTDLPLETTFVPGRLGVRARARDDGEFELYLEPRAEILHHGVVRASVLAFVVDAVAGILLDQDPGAWAFTTDLSLRMRPDRPIGEVSATCRILREGRRSATSEVEIVCGGRHLASGAIGFARVPLRDGDPPKPLVTPEMATSLFDLLPVLSEPLRTEAGVVVLDAAAGVVEMAVSSHVVNPAGTLQGAMVALLVESAAEEVVSSAFGGADVVVTDLDIRFLAPAKVGPVRTSTRLVGTTPLDGVEVRLHDTSDGRLTTLAYARAVRS